MDHDPLSTIPILAKINKGGFQNRPVLFKIRIAASLPFFPHLALPLIK